MNTVQNYKNIQKSDYMDGFILNITLLKTLIPIRASFPTHQFSTFLYTMLPVPGLTIEIYIRASRLILDVYN